MTPPLDAFLVAHQLDPRVFDICWGLSPVSIRDQMLRGRMVAERLTGLELVHKDAPLLVVGAGVSGVTAAITAALKGVPTTLVEATREPFGVQAPCDTRYLHPSQYDWPLPHWREGSFPPRTHASTQPLPLAYDANHASRLVRTWRDTLQEFEDALGEDLLRVCYGVKPRDVTGDSLLSRCDFDFESWATKKPGHQEFGAIISAAGFGHERVRARNAPDAFAAVRFWQSDNLEELKGLNNPRVVIAGGGDGALQDFIRVASGFPSAKALMEHLLPPEGRVPWELRETLLAAEDQAQRAYAWAGSEADDHGIHSRLHQAHRQVVQRLFSQEPSVAPRISALLDSRPFSQLTLVHACTHFVQSYALNRLLVCMLQEAVARVPGRGHVQVLSGSGIDDVDCVGCPTPPEASRCVGQPHCVHLKSKTCHSQGARHQTLKADVVVLRLGIDRGKAPPFGERPGGSLQRQLLPYFPTP